MYRGTICDYCETTRKHQVIYVDGDRRFYSLPDKVFRFVWTRGGRMDIQYWTTQLSEL